MTAAPTRMKLGKAEIVDTFAEAFAMWGTRAIITADSKKWAHAAGEAMTGFATSVIQCRCEAAIERRMSEAETPDGRPGISVLLFTMKQEDIGKRLIERVGQCVMTCPTTACYNGLDAKLRVPVGNSLRYFGDGYQFSKRIGTRRLWRIPVMEGEFLVEDSFGIQAAIGGGNLLLLGSKSGALRAASAAAERMGKLPGILLPFPLGVVRSGSKVGSNRYKKMPASTNDAYCPTLRAAVENSKVPEGIEAVYEIVVNGLDEAKVVEAMRCGMQEAAEKGARFISAANYGGNLGKYSFHLHDILQAR